MSILKFMNAQGTEVSAEVLDSVVVTITTADGKVKVLNKAKSIGHANMPITEMDQEQLKNEIRNANSVLYKTTKKAKDEGKLEDPEFLAKVAPMKERLEAAKKLMDEKFPHAARQSKATKAQAILKAIKESNLPEDQKAAALEKLQSLIAVLETSAKSGKPAAEVAKEETKTSEAPEKVAEGTPDTKAADTASTDAKVADTASTDAPSRRRR